ncbi:hypothetical protein JCM3770_003480 [Rhodotorula araucariae]
MSTSDGDSPFALASPPPSPSPTPSPPPSSHRGPSSSRPHPGSRKGRWAPAEQEELLAVGDAHGGGSSTAAWDEIRARLQGEARGRSTQALKLRYAMLVRDRREREQGVWGQVDAGGDVRMMVDSPASFARRVVSASGSGPSASSAVLVGGTFSSVNGLPAPAPLQARPWTTAEDAALFTAMATPPFGPCTWTQVHALTQRVYFLTENGAAFGRSEAETRARWEGPLRSLLSQIDVPSVVTQSIEAIYVRLTTTWHEMLVALNPALAHSLRATTSALATAPITTVPASASASASGRAAPPFPARASPVLVPAGPRPATDAPPAPSPAGDLFALAPFMLALQNAPAPSAPALAVPMVVARDAATVRPFSIPTPTAPAPVRPALNPASGGDEEARLGIGGEEAEDGGDGDKSRA